MSFYYRKSVNLGPFRVNLSKSGLGYSVGGRGFRVGTTARGKKIHELQHPRNRSRLSQIWCWLPCPYRCCSSWDRHHKTSPHFMNLSWKRTLRTASSERFLAQREGKDVAAVDLHYLASGTVAGTVILLKDAGWKESDVPALLSSLDEDFLPDVDLDHGNLNYTVVLGEVLGNYEAEKSK